MVLLDAQLQPRLVADTRGDRIPDFSSVGYRAGGVALPDVPEKVVLGPEPGSADDTTRIQQGLDAVATLPVDAFGHRGALLLRRGEYRIAGTIQLKASGIVLRGEAGTVLRATGTTPRHVVEIGGAAPWEPAAGTRADLVEDRIPVGATALRVASGHRFRVGDTVNVVRLASPAWIAALRMDLFKSPKVPWTASAYTLDYERTVTAVDGDRLTLDVPLVMSIERRWGGGYVERGRRSGRLRECGVENLRVISSFDPQVVRDYPEFNVKAEPVDENHAHYAVTVRGAEDCWIRRVIGVHFYYGTVFLQEASRRITVADCANLDPVSAITGGRRYSFTLQGQQGLVLRCYSRGGRHDFVQQSKTSGPNVFLDCAADRVFNSSEPHHRFSTGALYDNLLLEGEPAVLMAVNRGDSGSGHGWAGAWMVFWNCRASALIVMDPPTARNLIVGVRARPGDSSPFGGMLRWVQKQSGETLRTAGLTATNCPDSVVSPTAPVAERSLYLRQLRDRLGLAAVQNVTTPAQRRGDLAAIGQSLRALANEP